MLPHATTYEELVDRFRWQVPGRFNIGVDVADRQAPEATALIHLTAEGDRHWRFRDLARASNRLANALRALGVRRGDRIGILLPQRPETAIAHITASKLG
ncbi:MAG: AMP-binding protein, partial [Oceanicaulis sp.]|nr:AMP-binding protein [Oceanicaulis sp.]